MMPEGTPMATATSRAHSISISVGSARSRERGHHRPVEEVGLAEIAAQHAPVEAEELLVQIGRSRPRDWRVASIWAGVASGPSMTLTGSPGIRWMSRKTTVTTTASTGRRREPPDQVPSSPRCEGAHRGLTSLAVSRRYFSSQTL